MRRFTSDAVQQEGLAESGHHQRRQAEHGPEGAHREDKDVPEQEGIDRKSWDHPEVVLTRSRAQGKFCC